MKRTVWLALGVIACKNDQGFVGGVPPQAVPTARPLPNTKQTDAIVQVTTPKVDVLWTVDNSCSMSEEQHLLAQNFPYFIDYFIGSGLDYHIGVVTTDCDDPNQNGKLMLGFGYKYIDPDTASPEDVFSEMAMNGTSGSGNERGLEGSFKALEVDRDTYNAGFYRDDASINTIVVSDEPDSSRAQVITEPEYVDWYDDLKDQADMRTFSAIVDFSDGQKYLATQAAIGGIRCEIETDDWSSVLDELGLSLPVFIKWDDSEYGLRAKDAGYPTVTFPGAAVWHIPWTDKNDALDWQSYFHQRNRFIAALLHSPYDRGGRMVRESLNHQIKHLVCMQYSTVELRH